MSKLTVLFAPEPYWSLTKSERKQLCNGCGPKGFGFLVPDTFYFLDISEACNIHDFMYGVGKTIADKESADRAFLNNALRIIDAKSRFPLLRFLRKRRAYKYYLAVSLGGGPAFWVGKNNKEQMSVVTVK